VFELTTVPVPAVNVCTPRLVNVTAPVLPLTPKYVEPTADVTPVLLIVNAVVPLVVLTEVTLIAVPAVGTTLVKTRLPPSNTVAACNVNAPMPPLTNNACPELVLALLEVLVIDQATLVEAPLLVTVCNVSDDQTVIVPVFELTTVPVPAVNVCTPRLVTVIAPVD